MRTAEIKRKTGETDITLRLELDGTGIWDIDTGVGFLDHMLTLFAKHGRFDLTLSCVGDTRVDDHHSVEDIAICLGQAFKAALGEKKGICRYGDITLPMDETLVLVAVDISGRSGFYGDLHIPAEKVGTFDTELGVEFWTAFAREAGLTMHLRQLAGSNSHHILEAVFKAAGHALRKAVSIDWAFAQEVPSTKGTLS